MVNTVATTDMTDDEASSPGKPGSGIDGTMNAGAAPLRGVRLLLGAALASLAFLLVVLASFWVIGVRTGADPAVAARDVFGHLSLFVIFLGWPALSLLTALVLYPAYSVLERPSSLRVLHATAAAGMIGGAVGLPLFWFLFLGVSKSLAVWAVVGGLGGLVAGWVFWRVARLRD